MRLPTAVPDVVTTATGRGVPAAASPRAMPERQERGGALVDAHVQRHLGRTIGARRCGHERVRHRSGARARAQDEVLDAVHRERGDQFARKRADAVGHTITSRSRARSTPSTGTRGSAHRVGREQQAGAEPARVRQLRQRARERDARRPAQRKTPSRWTPPPAARPLGNLEARLDPAQRRHLEHDDVGGVCGDHGVGVAWEPHGLVGGDGRVHAPPQRREIRDRRARLLHVLEPIEPSAARGKLQFGERAHRVVNIPRAVRVDAHSPPGPSAPATASTRAASWSVDP